MTTAEQIAMCDALGAALNALERTDSELGSVAFEREKEAMELIVIALETIAEAGAPAAPVAEVLTDALDAQRYRWLRHGDNDEKVLRTYGDTPNTVYLPRLDHLDEAIDEAIASTKKDATS